MLVTIIMNTKVHPHFCFLTYP